jgi:tRNA modification GTPase
VLEVHLDLGGYPVTVLDTAGIREATDPVEREGVRRASEQAADADLVLWIVDATEQALRRCRSVRLPEDSTVWLVVNKMDLVGNDDAKIKSELEFIKASKIHFISCATGAGLDELVNALSGFAEDFFTPEPALVTRERQRALLRETVVALRGAEQAALDEREEIVAEHLRLATRALGRLLGRVDVEDILDVIFRDFCIGK